MTTLHVRELMTEKVFALNPEDDLVALHDLMDEKDVRHVPIVDEEQMLVGLVSQRDVLRRVLAESADLPLSYRIDTLRKMRVRDIMTRDVETTQPDEALASAARTMLENKYGCLPVVEDGRLTGILTEADFVRHLAEASDDEAISR
jgi:CBS domain-containing membrane protein